MLYKSKVSLQTLDCALYTIYGTEHGGWAVWKFTCQVINGRSRSCLLSCSRGACKGWISITGFKGGPRRQSDEEHHACNGYFRRSVGR